MYLIAGIFVVFTIILLSLWCSRHYSFKHILIVVRYHIVYYVLGFKALIEDLLSQRYNKLDLPIKNGYVAVITGGARGLGVEVVKKLLQCEMDVIIGCRNVPAGEKMIASLRSKGVTGGRTQCFPLDMASFSSIRQFGSSVLNKAPMIHILINNAGIMFVPFSLTEDGFESHFGVNYLGHCLLTHLLLPHIIASSPDKNSVNGRIVNVSSCAHEVGHSNFDNFNKRSSYIPNFGYAQSKLAQLLFTKSLDEKLCASAIRVQVHAVHPGIVNTELFDGTFLKFVAPWMPWLMFKTPEEGARTVVFAAVSPVLEGRGGSYISNCREQACSKVAESSTTREKLWGSMMSMLRLDHFIDQTR